MSWREQKRLPPSRHKREENPASIYGFSLIERKAGSVTEIPRPTKRVSLPGMKAWNISWSRQFHSVEVVDMAIALSRTTVNLSI